MGKNQISQIEFNVRVAADKALNSTGSSQPSDSKNIEVCHYFSTFYERNCMVFLPNMSRACSICFTFSLLLYFFSFLFLMIVYPIFLLLTDCKGH